MADRFARIAKTKVTPREKIAEVQPRQFRERIISLDACSGEPLPVPKKADTKEELQKLLAAQRKAYQPFLSDHAPAIASHREKIAVENFTVDGEPVNLPHYGGPTGYAKKVYKAQFVLDKKEDGQLYYICFGGVDYIAVVSVNGHFVGRHEGFFSPFSFEITDVCRPGLNELCVEVENDCVYAGNEDKNGREVLEGDKLYAATGLGWDDPVVGWHHCPPGMGIWGDVHVERRSREYIADLYVRPDPENGFAEIWVDAYSADYDLKMLRIDLCICGKNFEASALEKTSFETRTQDGQYLCRVGLEGRELFCKKGLNEYRIRVPMKNFRLWQPDAPYLYEAQAALVFDGQEKDTARRQFGMRSFRQDTVSKKKGMLYLNGRALKLRGANTMGFEQQDVLRRDFEQLIDDILLAKICHMNFWRLTQRPVQEEVYEYCDKLGLMTQTDLPLFGVMRRTRYAEGVRQAEEMERIIRSHPCNVVVSLINEPTANGGDEPHRHLRRPELEQFFESCASVIRILNPDRVLKYVDGDYDPPSSNMPDNHCYNQWYNGHTIDAGKMHKGYWCAVKPGWYYGCGEFGIEGLDYPEIMRQYYPKEWIREPFEPKNIWRSQTGSFYPYFYPRQHTLEDWVKKSQQHQADGIRMMTEAFRRNPDMATIAVHLFIDAWPNGWMKTIMDFKRNPKPAYFAYRDALEPVMLSLRTDRLSYYAGEEIKTELYLCNDTDTSARYDILFELLDRGGKVVRKGSVSGRSKPLTSVYVATPSAVIEDVEDRERFTLRAVLKDGQTVITYAEQTVEVFARQADVPEDKDTVWVTGLTKGEYDIAGEHVVVSEMPMGPSYFVSVAEDGPLAGAFRPMDFKNWYDEKADRMAPICSLTFRADHFKPLLTGADARWDEWNSTEVKSEAMVLAEKEYMGKRYLISTLDIRTENPVARRLLNVLNEKRKNCGK